MPFQGTTRVENIETASTVRLVLQSPLYFGATVALFLSGLGSSAAAPQIAQFLVNELGASLTVAGLFYLTSLTAPFAGYVIGSRSDRTGNRLGLFRICAFAGFIGWIGMGFSTQLCMPFVISAVILGFAGAATSQLFAAIHDQLSVHPTRDNDGIVAIVRMSLTAGWVVGPVGGSLIADAFGPRVMFIVVGLIMLSQVLPLGKLGTSRSGGSTVAAARTPHRPDVVTMLPLLAFTGLYILVYAGEAIKYAYLPIYMNNQLDFPAGLRGAIIGIQPLVELPLIPVAVVLAKRYGMIRLMVLAAGFGVTANLLFALSGTATGLFAGQILMGGVWGVFAALGIIVAQRLLPVAIATASAIFLSSTALSNALGGLAGGLAAGSVGLPHVFFVPAIFGIMAIFGLAIMDRKYQSRM